MEHQYSKMVLGSNEEEMEEKLWDKWEGEENPPVFSFLELAQDGGFSEVKDLYYPSRWITSAMLILFVFYNVYTVVQLDYFLIYDEAAAEDLIGEPLSTIEDKFYLSKPLIRWLYSCLGIEFDPDPTEVLGFLELSWLFFQFVNVLYCLVMVYVDKGGFRRWYHVQFIFWEILPALSTYSAMKLLNAIVPSVFIYNLLEKIGFIQESISEKKGNTASISTLKLVWWLFVVVPLSFLIGFDTFLMKLRLVSSHANMDLHGFWPVLRDIILPVLQFLVQTLGVVQLGPFVRKRLFIFIFGGEDGIMQDEEIELMETWNALLARRMFRDLSTLHFIAVMTSFCDEDFQSLVLNENKEVKMAAIGT